MNGQYVRTARCYERTVWQEGGELVDTSTAGGGLSGASSCPRRMQRSARGASDVATTLRRSSLSHYPALQIVRVSGAPGRRPDDRACGLESSRAGPVEAPIAPPRSGARP